MVIINIVLSLLSRCLSLQMSVKHEYPHSFTQDGDHHVSSQYLYGSSGYEVEGGQDVASVDQRITRGRVGSLELHGQRSEAALRGAFESLAVLQ